MVGGPDRPDVAVLGEILRCRPVVVFFEMMLEAYQEKYGSLREGDIPPDDEIIDMFLTERDNRDAK